MENVPCNVPLQPSPPGEVSYHVQKQFYLNKLLELVQNESTHLTGRSALANELFLWDSIHTDGFHELIRQFRIKQSLAPPVVLSSSDD